MTRLRYRATGTRVPQREIGFAEATEVVNDLMVWLRNGGSLQQVNWEAVATANAKLRWLANQPPVQKVCKSYEQADREAAKPKPRKRPATHSPQLMKAFKVLLPKG
jgi:hypothetical protein